MFFHASPNTLPSLFDDGAMPKTMTTQDDNATPCPSHSPDAKQDKDKNTPPFTLTAPASCDPSTPLPRDTTSHLDMMPADTTYSKTASGLRQTHARVSG